MTREKYDKASEILDSIHYYHDLLNLLENSRGNYLAAERKMVSTDTMNTVHISEDEPIIEKFIEVVKNKIRYLEYEFDNL